MFMRQAFLEQLFCTWHITSMVGQRCSLAVGPSSSSQRRLDRRRPCPLNVGFSTPSIILPLQTTVNTQSETSMPHHPAQGLTWARGSETQLGNGDISLGPGLCVSSHGPRPEGSPAFQVLPHKLGLRYPHCEDM